MNEQDENEMPDYVLSEDALLDLPVFPLGQVVLFPDAFLPLHIFEPRYRAMLKHCMETHRAFAVAHVPDPADLDQYENSKIALVAGVGVVVEHESMPRRSLEYSCARQGAICAPRAAVRRAVSPCSGHQSRRRVGRDFRQRSHNAPFGSLRVHARDQEA